MKKISEMGWDFEISGRRIDGQVWSGEIEKLYVVVSEDRALYDEETDKPIFTLSPDPCCVGWETDCSYPGYGLPYKVARMIADYFNHAKAIEPKGNGCFCAGMCDC